MIAKAINQTKKDIPSNCHVLSQLTAVEMQVNTKDNASDILSPTYHQINYTGSYKCDGKHCDHRR